MANEGTVKVEFFKVNRDQNRYLEAGEHLVSASLPFDLVKEMANFRIGAQMFATKGFFVDIQSGSLVVFLDYETNYGISKAATVQIPT